MNAAVSPLMPTPGLLAPNWANWRLALLLAVVVAPLAIFTLPPAVSFWVSLAAVSLVAITAVVNAWGRYTGGLLVAPALALLFVMNIFPLMWSFGLSFFAYRANRQAPPSFVGLQNYEWALSDPTIWDRLQVTALTVVLTVSVQMIVGFLLALLFERQFPGRRFLMILVLTPMMLSFVAVGAFFRYYYEPTFGLLSQVVRLFTGEPFILLETPAGALGRHHLRRRLDVVALRHAAGPGRPGLGAEIPLRGGRDRPGQLVAQVQHDHLPLYQGPAACWPCCSAPSRPSSCSTWSS